PSSRQPERLRTRPTRWHRIGPGSLRALIVADLDTRDLHRCLGMPRAFHRRPRRAAADWQAWRRLDSRVYTELWGQTGDCSAAFTPPADGPGRPALAG